MYVLELESWEDRIERRMEREWMRGKKEKESRFKKKNIVYVKK